MDASDVSVAVVGGGIGGLTAAHHLVERGFDVRVYEAADRFGGKARSVPVDDGPNPLHGEHGFRFFPAFYNHVTDTMASIPDGSGTVADNLVETEETLIARVDADDRWAETGSPDSLRGWVRSLLPAFADDLPSRDVRFVLERLLYVLTACDERRERELDDVSWWEFIDADNRSQAFRDELGYVTQALVALRPEVASARTMATIYLQLLFGQLDPTRPTEQILNGPTSEAWIRPWVDHLASLGVEFHPSSPVTGVAFDAASERVTGIDVDGDRVTADQYVLAVPVEVAPRFFTDGMVRAAPELGRVRDLDTAWMNGVQFYLTEDVPLAKGHQVYADSPWALTAISQRQFWTEFEDRDDAVEGVLSVIASDWDTPGVVYGKPARNCTREEIVEEVWTQLKQHLNRAETRLTDDVRHSHFLDPALVETDDGVENRSPLLINTVGSLKNRPPAGTGIGNLSLAADYVRTNSDLASMESADEAGRRATNAILRRTGVNEPLVDVYDLEEPAVFEPFKRQDRLRYRLGLPHPAEVTHSVRSLTDRLRAGVRP